MPRSLFLILPLAASILFQSSCEAGRDTGEDGSSQLRDYSALDQVSDGGSPGLPTPESSSPAAPPSDSQRTSSIADSLPGSIPEIFGGGDAGSTEGNTPFNLASGGKAVERDGIVWFAAYQGEYRVYRWNRDTGNCLALPFSGGEDTATGEIHHINLLGPILCFILGRYDGADPRSRGVLVTMGADGSGIRIHGEISGLTGLAVSGDHLYGGCAGGLFLLDTGTGESHAVSDIPAVTNLVAAEGSLFFLSGDSPLSGIYRYSPATGRTERLPIDDAALFSIQDGLILGIKSGSPGLFSWDPATGEERILSARSFHAPVMITDSGIISWRDDTITLLSVPDDVEEILLEGSVLWPQAAGELLFFGTPGNPPDYGFVRMDGTGRIGLSEIVTRPRIPAPADPEKADFITVPGLLYHVYTGVRELPGRVRYLEFRRMDGNAMEESSLLVPVPALPEMAPEHVWAGSRSAELSGYLGREIEGQLLSYDYLALVGAVVPNAVLTAGESGTASAPAGIIIVDAPFSCLEPEAIQGAMEDARNMIEGLPPRFLIDWKAGRTESGSRQYALSVLVMHENGQGESGFGDGGSCFFSVEYLLGDTGLKAEGEGGPRETVASFAFSVSRVVPDSGGPSGHDRNITAETEAIMTGIVALVLDRLEIAVRETFSLIPVEPGMSLQIRYRNGTMSCRYTEDSCEYLF